LGFNNIDTNIQKKGIIMDIHSQVVIEIKKDDHVFRFSMPLGSPFGKAYDAAYEVLQHIVDLSKKAAEQAKQADSTATN